MKVSLKIDEPLPLRNDGVILHVSDKNGRVGRLRIGKATVEWMPVGKWKDHGHKFSMREFCEYLTAAGDGKMKLKPKN